MLRKPLTFTELLNGIVAEDGGANETAIREAFATRGVGGGGITVGQGAPNPQLFVDAYNRSGFSQFVTLPPQNAVHRWNCSTCDPNNSTWGKGLIQDFNSTTAGVHSALMLADTNTNFVVQIYGGMWDKFTQLGALQYNSTNARMLGYPIGDRNCSDFNATCFPESALISPFGTRYHYQRFQGGALVLHKSGSRLDQTFEVHGPIRSRWQALNGPDGSYGLPISDEYISSTKRRSDFEGGSICYNPSTGQTEDGCVTPTPPQPPSANSATNISTNAFTANWGSSSGASGYRLDVSATSTFSSFLSGYQNLDVGNALTRSVTGLNPSTTYYYRVRAYNSNGTSGNSNSISVTTATQNYTINVSVSPSAGGTVGGGGTFASGSSRTVTASANSGYTFVNWTENGSAVSSSSSYTFTLTGNRNLIANFTANQVNYTINVSASPSAGGTVGGGGTFASGSSRTVTASANSGYTFVNWTENGSAVSSSSSYTFTLTGNRNLIANFSANQVNYTINVSASPSAGGTVGGGGTFASGSSRTVTASANSGYTFVNWTENGSAVSSSSSYTFTLTGNRNLIANFSANQVNYTINVSASPSAGGTVGGGGTFASGSSRTVTASANSGYTFVNWTENGSAVSSSSSYTFTLLSNRTLVANFAAIGITSVQFSSANYSASENSNSHTLTVAIRKPYIDDNRKLLDKRFYRCELWNHFWECIREV